MIVTLLGTALLLSEVPPSSPDEAPPAAAVKPADPALPDRSTRVGMRSSVSATSGGIAFFSVEGGIEVEHRLGEATSIGVAFDVAVQASNISGAAVSGLSTTDYLTLTFEPMVRRWVGDGRPLDGVFIGLNLPLSHFRSLKGPDAGSWRGGLYAQLGYSLLVGRGLVIQAAIGPGFNVSSTKFSLGAGAISETLLVAAGLRSMVSFGYAF